MLIRGLSSHPASREPTQLLRQREAALALACERAISDITVEGIAHAAGVSRRTVVNHVESKNHAVILNFGRHPHALDRFLAGEEPELLGAIEESARAALDIRS